MRAFTLDGFGDRPGLRNDIRDPQAGDGELLVRVRASSVNGVDVFIAAGALKEMAEHEFPVTLGRDFAGVVEQVGPAQPTTRLARRSSDSFPMPTPRCTTGVGRS